MAAITMHSTTSLAKILAAQFPEISFQEGATFAWSHLEKQVKYIPGSSDIGSLLHEVSHAILGHQTYQRDIELLGHERDAWMQARVLAPNYGIEITEGIVQSALDTYRDWLHARSTCPSCSATGIQTAISMYLCPVCRTSWQVNSATTCALRRYTTKKRTA